MEAKFSNRVKEVISLSREEAIRLGHDYIGTEHLLLGIIREGEGTALTLLRKLGVSLDELKFSLEQEPATRPRRRAPASPAPSRSPRPPRKS